ncbi:MAG: hypothetical protein H7Y39_17145 [Nitrospiraceae bacterium]|nr:hypothetical protein [Nitrospiraceae bacterium]
MSTRFVLTTRRNHITNCLSVQDDEYPTEIFIRQNIGRLIKSPAEALPQDTQQNESSS